MAETKVESGAFDTIFLAKDAEPPVTNPKLFSKSYLVNGEIKEFKGEIADITSPICAKLADGGMLGFS
jgi:hypothetical protein